MDLEQHDTLKQSEAGTTMHIVSPMGDLLYIDDEETDPMTLTLLGSDSPEVRRYRHKIANQKLNKSFRAGRLKLEQTEDDDLDLLAMATIACHVKLSGELVEFNRLNIINLYKRFPWIKEQADAHIGDRANYVGNSQKTS